MSDAYTTAYNATSWRALLTTVCRAIAQWEDRDYPGYHNATMTWDGFDPMPDVTCMVCLVKGARR